MKVFITKYWLSEGIIEYEGNNCRITQHGGLQIIRKERFGYEYYARSEWFKSKDEAKIQANRLRDKRIESLQRQIEKLKGLKF